jgi:murein DD-endopeptidase MepM/ murein hydrolase activator NlpD
MSIPRITKSVFILVFVLALTSFAGSYFIFRYIDVSQQDKKERAGPEKEIFNVIEYAIESGDTWETITKKFSIDWNLGASLLEAAKDVHNLAALHQGNEFRFVYDIATNELIGAEYDIDDEKFLKIEKNADGNFGAMEENIQYEVKPTIKRGVIESSLFETAQREDIPANIIMEMARIFAWDVDFASSVQPQDSFIMAYEERFRDGEKGKPGKILAGEFINDGRKVYALYYEDPMGGGEYYNEEGRVLKRQFLRSPLDYKRITSGFSYNRFHPILQSFTTHRAIDYSASSGTPVSATGDGVVNYVGWKGGNGKFVGIRHEQGYETGYAHLSAYAKGIKAGARVEQNQIIGFVGSTGWSTGPHLHYEMRKNGILINPLRLDLPPGKMIKEEYKEEFLQKKEELLKLLSG